jgi:hypothetical protein
VPSRPPALCSCCRPLQHLPQQLLLPLEQLPDQVLCERPQVMCGQVVKQRLQHHLQLQQLRLRSIQWLACP